MALLGRSTGILYARPEYPNYQQTGVESPFTQTVHYLVQHMEPEFGLLDRLLSDGLLTQVEFQNVRSAWSVTAKNEAIVNYMFGKNGHLELLRILKDTNQSHLANYLTADGVYRPSCESNIPLMDREEATINVNQEILVELIERTSQLAQALHSNGVLNVRQMDYICGQSGDMKRNEALLDILRKRSIKSYHETINLLRISGQHHAADMLYGGATARIYCRLTREEDNIDDREVKDVVARLQEILNDPLAEALALKQFGLRRVKFDNGIICYFHFVTLDELDHLREHYTYGKIEILMRTDFDALMLSMGHFSLTVTWDPNDFRRCLKYFYRVSFTSIDSLPIETLDLILLKVFGICFCSNISGSAEETILKWLRSVSQKWNSAISRSRFELPKDRLVSRFLQKISKTRDIIWRNQRFLQDNIEPDVLINPLFLADCLTDCQVKFINSILRRSSRCHELLKVISEATFEKQRKFLDCLRSSRQQRVADLIEKGGVLVKSVVKTSARSTDIEAQLVIGLRKILQEFDQHRLKQLYIDIGLGCIEVFEASWDRDIFIWLWCPSIKDLSHLKDIYLTSDLLKAVHSLFQLIWRLLSEGFYGNITFSRINPTAVIIENTEFEKQVAVRSTSPIHQKSLNTGGQLLFDVTSLKGKIYLRFSKSLSVYEDLPPFTPVKNVDVPSTITFKPNFTKACERNVCLYTTSDSGVCKLSAMDYSLEIWLSGIGLTQPCPMSVCCDGRLLILRKDIPLLCIELYRADAQLVQSVTLPTTLHSWTSLSYYCAIESDAGEFIVSYRGSEEFRMEYKLALVTRVGRSCLVISPQPKGAWNQPHFVEPPCVTPFKRNLFIVYDSKSGKVVTLDHYFSVTHVLLTRVKQQIYRPRQIHYKKMNSQLIIIDSYNSKDVVVLFSLVEDREGEPVSRVSAKRVATLDTRNLFPTDVTSLRNDILILLNGELIAVYEDKNQFNHKFDVLLREIISPGIGASFLQVIADNNTGDVYVATSIAAFRLVGSPAHLRQSGDPIAIGSHYSVSLSNDGNLLIPTTSPPTSDIHEPDRILKVNLPSYMDEIAQVVEISSEMFVIVYKTSEHRNRGNILKLKANGEFELRPKPDGTSDQIGLVWSLARYSSDRVIATDEGGHRVILLDSELNTQYNLLKCKNPMFMCYKKDKRQLIVGHTQSSRVDVFSFDIEKHYKPKPTMY